MASPAMLILTMMVMSYYVNAQAPVGVPVQSPMAVSVPSMAPGPAGATDCMTAVFGLSDCLDYVQNGSTATKPAPACCPELSGLIRNQPTCLCLLLGDTSSYGLEIDVSRALQLPTTCGLQLPDLSACPAAPSPNPGGSLAGSEVPASSPGGVGLGPDVAASPGSLSNGNEAPTIVASGLAVFVALAIAFAV